ncbi:MAG: hypothetical protein ACRD0A_02320 [Acidimicrobiales bacterium]
MIESTPRRPTGDHWWDADRQRHLADLPRFCPGCGEALDPARDLAVEFWEADHRAYHIWCRRCGWAGDIVRVDRIVGHEPE